MYFWENLYKDQVGKVTLKLTKNFMQYNYDMETIGLNFNDLMHAIQGVNENKAV